ncbi:hypothetical protein MLD38_021121 [Melastoma candidum]|uniref:Uncharacterized protein n=1 Tax=Melastoma candidum TaxID=119954 RepID=A0ACB9QG10_9MYRT|nr:hypothetical protein MLD38_021121 [Melastoma candidum]
MSGSKGMSKRKRRHASSDSSSSRPPVEGTSTRRKKKRRVAMLEKQMEEMKGQIEELRNQGEEHERQREEQERQREEEHESQIEELRTQLKKQGKKLKKQGKKIKKLKKKAPKQKPTSLSPGNPPPPESVQEGNAKLLKLRMEMKVSRPVYTTKNLVGDSGNSIRISLIDAENGQTIIRGPMSSIKVRVVVLGGNFDQEDHKFWDPEEFYRYITKGRTHKGPLLIGDLQVTLKEGVGFINNLRVMDNSSWMPDGKFRIGVHVDSGYYEVTRIREAFSEPIVVLEKRGELNEKHYPPQSSDPVWRLEGIGKDGTYCKKLNDNGITSVEQFLQDYNRQEHKLREILTSRMAPMRWEALIKHAQTCPPNGKWLVYRDESGVDLLFNNFASLTGFVWDGTCRPIDSLSDDEKQYVKKLVEAAYQKWEHATEGVGINPLHELVARPAGNHDGIPVGTFNVTNSGVVTEQEWTLQQFVAQEIGRNSHDLPNGDNYDSYLSIDELQ